MAETLCDVDPDVDTVVLMVLEGVDDKDDESVEVGEVLAEVEADVDTLLVTDIVGVEGWVDDNEVDTVEDCVEE